ncbi:hypothetical protein GGS21DRAFT_443059 [Xylaria nigripes]|nr:hypothetical protein GGS21DRAFT_443059 [Xylaria nigripes]
MEASILPKNISISRFNELLSRYSSLIKSISDKASNKSGQPTLLELDEFRYMKATEALQSSTPKRKMTHDDVKTLVNWKLRHGKFRPSLMKLVSSNDGLVVEKTIQKTMEKYWSDRDVTKAMDAIAELKGIGPATASLLLSVHDPKRVIFLSDEAFWWVCCNGRKSPIKYNAKEYQQLDALVGEMTKRLQVGATDIEKVAYVVMKDGPSEPVSSTEHKSNLSGISGELAKDAVVNQAPAKRKVISVIDTDSEPLRHSRRHKTS